jgi:hypothetical protein
MGKISKYYGLYVYLSKREEESIKLTFEEIERKIGEDFPDTAYKREQFWAGSIKSHKHTSNWQDAGYRAALRKKEGCVEFIRLPE